MSLKTSAENESSNPLIFTTVAALKQWRQSLAPTTRVGFVATMGALHSGHAALIGKLKSISDVGVLSIFVNPKQFGPNEDLDKYPRTFEADVALAKENGIHVIFAPAPEELYPKGFSTFVEEAVLSQYLCGAVRPGHFKGVTTVVLKLFNLIKPAVALFGLKDAQQYLVLHKMVHDLNLDVEVQGVTTVREPDGLALSSRNRYLSAEHRTLAPQLYKTLQSTAARIEASPGMPVKAMLADASATLQAQGFKVQYFELRRLTNLSFFDKAPAAPEPALLAIAAHLGTTRLIDNIIIRPSALDGLFLLF